MPMETRIIVCGSRDFSDHKLLNNTLNNIVAKYENVRIISGHARGADMFGECYAKNNNIPCTVMRAEWDKYGKQAGFIRNNQMIEFAKQANPVVVAFWDGKSHGTKHSIEAARNQNIETYVINY